MSKTKDTRLTPGRVSRVTLRTPHGDVHCEGVHPELIIDALKRAYLLGQESSQLQLSALLDHVQQRITEAREATGAEDNNEC